MSPEAQRIAIAEACVLGHRFNRLIVVSKAPTISVRNKRWLCRCDCGTEKIVAQSELRSGKTQSCGCLRREVTALNKTKHGNARRGLHTKEYLIWRGMLSRCHNPSNPAYPDYGARGISVCERWRSSFSTFLADMGNCPAGLSIDRISNDGGYFRENCRWATAVQQAQNRRKRRWKKKP